MANNFIDTYFEHNPRELIVLDAIISSFWEVLFWTNISVAIVQNCIINITKTIYLFFDGKL